MSVTGRTYGGVSAAERVATRRQRLLAAGLERFGTTGYGATGVRDICREAGLTDRYFYESFRDSRALFLEVFDSTVEALLTAVAVAVAEAGTDAEAQLRAAIGTFLREMEQDPRKARLIFSEPAAVGLEAELHMRATLRRFASLASLTASTHVRRRTSEHMLQLVGLAVVGTIERVVIEWQDGELDRPMEQTVDDCVALLLRLLR